MTPEQIAEVVAAVIQQLTPTIQQMIDKRVQDLQESFAKDNATAEAAVKTLNETVAKMAEMMKALTEKPAAPTANPAGPAPAAPAAAAPNPAGPAPAAATAEAAQKQGIFKRAGNWLRGWWMWLVGGVGVLGAGYAAYRYFSRTPADSVEQAFDIAA